MANSPRPKSDDVEQAMKNVLASGSYIPDASLSSFVVRRSSFAVRRTSYVIELEGIASMMAVLVRDDPHSSVALYETFSAICDMKAEEVDDPCGMLGQFVGELPCGWIEARQEDYSDPAETAEQMLAWMDKDNYGFSTSWGKRLLKCSTLRRFDASTLRRFDASTLAAFTTLVRSRFDAAIESGAKQGGRNRESSAYIRRYCGDILRTLHADNQDVAAYLSRAEETGLTGKDFIVIATLLLQADKPQEALDWVDRGFDTDTQSSSSIMNRYELDELKREVLVKLGRSEEVINAVYLNYCHVEWRLTVHRVRVNHSRKNSFMPGLERLVGGWDRAASHPIWNVPGCDGRKKNVVMHET